MGERQERKERAIENTVKGPKADTHRRALSALLKSSALINSSLQISDVLNHAVKAAEEFMNAEASSVLELDQERGDIIFRLARGNRGGSVPGRCLAQDIRLGYESSRITADPQQDKERHHAGSERGQMHDEGHEAGHKVWANNAGNCTETIGKTAASRPVP